MDKGKLQIKNFTSSWASGWTTQSFGLNRVRFWMWSSWRWSAIPMRRGKPHRLETVRSSKRSWMRRPLNTICNQQTVSGTESRKMLACFATGSATISNDGHGFIRCWQPRVRMALRKGCFSDAVTGLVARGRVAQWPVCVYRSARSAI